MKGPYLMRKTTTLVTLRHQHQHQHQFHRLQSLLWTYCLPALLLLTPRKQGKHPQASFSPPSVSTMHRQYIRNRQNLRRSKSATRSPAWD